MKYFKFLFLTLSFALIIYQSFNISQRKTCNYDRLEASVKFEEYLALAQTNIKRLNPKAVWCPKES